MVISMFEGSSLLMPDVVVRPPVLDCVKVDGNIFLLNMSA